MTALRETIAIALMRHQMADIGRRDEWGDWDEPAKWGWRREAEAVLRTLATWEPSDRLVEGLAEMRFTATGIDWNKHIKDIVAAALRAMAEETP